MTKFRKGDLVERQSLRSNFTNDPTVPHPGDLGIVTKIVGTSVVVYWAHCQESFSYIAKEARLYIKKVS